MDETIEKKISDTENHTSEKVEILSNKPDEDSKETFLSLFKDDQI